jgi:DNA mismatch endonuclease (patch repair protein)
VLLPDVVSPATRSRMMAGIRGKNTRPEMLIRQGLHRLGYRFRLHAAELPGKPDLILPKYRAVIFVQGCFWHGHDCHLFKWPKTRSEWWQDKIRRTRKRDEDIRILISKLGWRQALVWECSLKGRTRRNIEEILASLSHWLNSQEEELEIEGRKLC